MASHPSAYRSALLPVLLVVGACSAGGGPSPSVATSPSVVTSPSPAALPSAATASAATAGIDARPTDTSGLGSPRPAPPLLDLVNPDGSAFELADLDGGPTLVFFGYTHCPDVCPATIGELYGVFEALPETQAVFVSIDPERDTPEFLATWTEYMPDNFNAVTGSPGAIRRAADGYGVRYARVDSTSQAGYAMSHSADMYLIDEAGRWLSTYPFGMPAADIVTDITMRAAGLHVSGAWAREALLVDLASAAYMVIDNGTAVDDALVGASSPAAAVTEIHQTSLAEDGSMAMAPVAEVPIPAQGSAILEPGGYHVMLVGLVAPLTQGTHIDVTLEFATSQDVTLSVPVQAASPMGDMAGVDAGVGDATHEGHAADPSPTSERRGSPGGQ